LEWHVIIRQLDCANVGAALLFDRASVGAASKDGGSDMAVMTAEAVQDSAGHEAGQRQTAQGQPGLAVVDPRQLELSVRTGEDGGQVVAMTGELDIATAEQAYAYLSDVLAERDGVSMDLSGLTFCDASGLSVLARVARRARKAGGQLRMVAARPALMKIIRITGLDRSYPELVPARASLSSASRIFSVPSLVAGPGYPGPDGRGQIAGGVRFDVRPRYI
jgi:anti-sigma B factor antagonist